MSTDIYLKQDDLAKAIEFVVEDDTLDFTGASVVFNMIDQKGNLKISEGAASIETEAYSGGTRSFFRYVPSGTDLDTVGQYRGEWTVTFANTKKGRFPERGYVIVGIGKKLDPVA